MPVSEIQAMGQLQSCQEYVAFMMVAETQEERLNCEKILNLRLYQSSLCMNRLKINILLL